MDGVTETKEAGGFMECVHDETGRIVPDERAERRKAELEVLDDLLLVMGKLGPEAASPLYREAWSIAQAVVDGIADTIREGGPTVRETAAEYR